jgi:hypothetical protein
MSETLFLNIERINFIDSALMKTNILWKGLLYNSLENCLVSTTAEETEVNSVIIGIYDNKIFKVEYLIRLNGSWQTIFCELRIQFADEINSLNFQSDGKGKWIMNGSVAQQFNGCTDIDISLTPFTNTLPVNRLKLKENENRLIKVVYIDVLNQQIKPLQQRYTKLSPREYKYENVPNDFEAVITVDEFGLVVNYPELFVRTIIESE